MAPAAFFGHTQLWRTKATSWAPCSYVKAVPFSCAAVPTAPGGPGGGNSLGGPVDRGESPPSALERELSRPLGTAIELDVRAADVRINGDCYDVSLGVVRQWQGGVVNLAPDEHDTFGWFASDELGALELTDTRYLGVLSAVLAGGKASLTWSPDGATVTKSLAPGVVVPQWTVMVHLLHLQLWLRTPNPFIADHKRALDELLSRLR